MALIGLMITRDDEAVFETWCVDQLPLYDAVVCLDGSTTDATRRIAGRFGTQLVYLHERDFVIPNKTDHGLRRIVHLEIVRRFGPGHWIMCCHADEFCYHDPRKIAVLGERNGYDLVSWYSPHFYPHPTELADWEHRRRWPVPDRHKHYHWGHVNTQQPWIEDRLYRDRPGIEWDDTTHGSVRPHGIRNEAPFHPIFRHFKVIATDSNWCQVIGDSTYYQHHWQGLEHRTGVPFRVERFEDLFVASVPKYDKCDRFDGVFDQSWNMGEEFRPDRDRQRLIDLIANATTEGNAAGIKKGPSVAMIGRRFSARRSGHPLRIALGPENESFGSWNWLGIDLAQELGIDHEVSVFTNAIPNPDVVVFFKFMPDAASLRAIRGRSSIVFCPVDVYGSAAEIDADAERLRQCDRLIVHCQRLVPYFQSYAPTSYLDHHVKYTIPTRNEIVTSGPILWVGEQSNLPPLAEWANRRNLPAELIVLTNLDPTTKPQSLGFNGRQSVRLDAWSSESHREWLTRCRCAIDIKGDDFRARHKPPAKALDFLASGVPFAMNRPSSPVHHLLGLGFEIPEIDDWATLLSPEYALECQRFGIAMSELLSLARVGNRWRAILQDVAAARRQSTNKT
jgi:hypothetical protein